MVSKAICFCEVYIKTGGIVVLIAVDGNERGITAAVGLLRVVILPTLAFTKGR